MRKAAIAGFLGTALIGAFAFALTARQGDAPQGGVAVVAAPASADTPAAAYPQPQAVAIGDAPLTQIGTVKPRSAAELKAANLDSLFSIGGETTDRNYSTYANWKSYLGQLGIRHARVQTGWADIQKTKDAPYDYAKLDAIVTDMKTQSVQPWFDLMYGNRNYTGGGGTDLGAGIPLAGTPGRTAWIKFVKDVVGHFKAGPNQVTEWQIWNEPDSNTSAADYGDFAAETANAIYAVQGNDAKILVAGLTGYFSNSYVRTMLEHFDAGRNPSIKGSNIQVVYHGYTQDPDKLYVDGYDTFKNFRAQVENAPRGYSIRMGEAGAPSQRQSSFSLNNIDWTEDSQAKWILRRALGDVYLGIPTNIFTMVDLHYAVQGKNTKGLLRTGDWSSVGPTYGDQTVKSAKVAYGAVQALAAIFDNRLVPIAKEVAGCTPPVGFTVQAYTRLDPGNVRRNMLVVWRDSDRPGVNEATITISFTCTGFNFPRFAMQPTLRPRYTDLLTRKVYAMNDVSMVQNGSGSVTVSGIPVYDGPVILSDQGIVLF